MKNILSLILITGAVLTSMMAHKTLAQTCSPPCNSGNYCAYDENNNPNCFFNCPGSYACWQGGTCCPGAGNPQGCCPAGQTCNGNGGCYYANDKKNINYYRLKPIVWITLGKRI